MEGFPGAIVVDIGSGGGDLLKYERQGITHVIAVEPNGDNRLIMEKRLKPYGCRTRWTIVPCGRTQDNRGVSEAGSSSRCRSSHRVGVHDVSMSFFWKDEGTLSTL